MKIQIERPVNNGLYAHYPGQVLIDHPDEKQLVESGSATPFVDEPETATIQPAERAVRRGRK